MNAFFEVNINLKRFQNPVPLKISESTWRKFNSWPHKVTEVNEKRLLPIFFRRHLGNVFTAI